MAFRPWLQTHEKNNSFDLLLPLGAAAGDSRDNMNPYPAPEAGFNRMVFNVTHQKNREHPDNNI